MNRLIPEGWDTRTIGSLSLPITKRTEQNNQHVPLTSARGGLFIQSDYFNKQVTSSNNAGYKILSSGEFTFRSMSDTGIFKFNRSRFGFDGIVSPAYEVFKAKNCDPDFLEFVLDSEVFAKKLYSCPQGGTRLALKYKVLSQVEIAIPEYHEQKKIAAILSSVDDVIEGTQKKINKLQDLKKAVMNELLSKGIGHTEFKDTELGRIPKSWKIVCLGKIAKCVGGGAFREILQGSRAGAYPFIKVSDMNLPGNERWVIHSQNWISTEVRDKEKIKLFPRKSIVFAKVGAALLLNRRRQLSRETAIDNNMMAAVPTNCDSDFLYYFLQTVDLGGVAQEGALPSVNQKETESILVAAPLIGEQKKIAGVLMSFDDVIESNTAKLEKYRSLKKGLMQDLMTGKVRVKV